MYSTDRETLRRTLVAAWAKAQAEQPLEPLEQQIAEVVAQHPEYHALFEQGEAALERDWLPEHGETNPFLHLFLHLSVLEQTTSDRPQGIRTLYRRMIEHCLGNAHEAEHRIIDCLGEELWQVERDQRPFSDERYLQCIKRRGGGRRRG